VYLAFGAVVEPVLTWLAAIPHYSL